MQAIVFVIVVQCIVPSSVDWLANENITYFKLLSGVIFSRQVIRITQI